MTVKHGLVQTISGTRNVWNLKVASKINMFAWKTLKRALPVGTRFVKCHIDVYPRCKRCGASEYIIHLLFIALLLNRSGVTPPLLWVLILEE